MDTNQEKVSYNVGYEPKKEIQKKRCQICGALVWRNNMRRHTSSQKHQDAIYIMHDKFEIK